MVNSKITNEKILKLFNSVSDTEVREALLKDSSSLCSTKFMYEHEDAFRSLIPKYFEKFKDTYRYSGIEDWIVVGKEPYMVGVCLQHGIVDPDDFTTVVNFATAGLEIYDLEHFSLFSIEEIFKEGILKLKDGDKKLLEFVDKNPQYLRTFLPIMCAIDNEGFSSAMTQYLQSAKLEDTVRIFIFRAMLNSSDANMLLRSLDEIEKNNYYRFKAMNEACVAIGDYTVVLPPKELVAVLRDAALGNCEKYLTADFRHAYHFINTYDRLHEDKFHSFALDVLQRGGDRARWALLNSLSEETVNGDYAGDIFSANLTVEDLSFFVSEIHGDKMDKSVMPIAFEKLFEVLSTMDKVNYHFKVDEDITFARDVFKSTVISKLGEIAVKVNNKEYIKRLDSIYDTLKEEAQSDYLKVVGDKTTLDKRSCAIKFLKTDNYYAINYFEKQNIKLTYDEAVAVSDYLKSKKEAVKTKIIKLYLSSKEAAKIMEYLLSCIEDYKKSAGEEMQKSLGNVDSKKLEEETVMFKWNSESVFKVDRPDEEIKNLANQKTDVKPLQPISYKRVKEFFGAIKDFIEANKDYEYASDLHDGLSQFGTRFERIKGSEIGSSDWEAYPFGLEIKRLIQDNATQDELASILAVVHCVQNGAKQLYAGICGDKLFGDANKIYEYVRSLNHGYWFDTDEYTIVRNFDNNIADEMLSKKQLLELVAAFAQKSALDKYAKSEDDDCYPFQFSHKLTKSDDVEILKALVHFECALLDAGAIESIDYDLMMKAYEYGLISQNLTNYTITKEGFAGLFSPKSSDYVMRSDFKYPKFKTLLLDFMEKALEVEFNRGSLQTLYSDHFRRKVRVFGMEKYFKAVVALRGLTWVRSPYGNEKNETLSNILKNTVKGEGDNYDKFVELIKKYKITDDELIKATLFNPEFVDYTAKYLETPHLKITVFWFIAHLNETLDDEKQEKRIEQIKEFSDISYPDFKDGAFDCKWYEEMIEKVPEKVLKKVYANAKYVTVGGLHKRAQRFFDAVGGRISKDECLEKIHGTRNKDYCLIYSLIPIESREDLYERYLTLAEFIRSGKQFGAQRQLSERRTVDIALENLARVAGYASPDIFIFEMEAENPSDIFKTYTIDNIQITPYIDESKFKITYSVKKDGKSISSIPSKYSKDETVVTMRDEIKKLNQKCRRIITSFENTMNTRVPFTLEQLSRMRRERIIATVLDKLVFLADGRLCVFDGELRDIDGKAIEAKDVYIAHPIELKKLGLLTSAIEYVARKNIRQPFKQVMREIYTKTDLELTQDEVLRFKGFEVDLKKCVSALKGKGWGVCEEIGLRKVYYRSDMVAAIFREWDYFYTLDFTNVNRELHGIFFLKRKSGEIIPIKDVDDITFSETLRDVDLMISISSKVIYDFALAMSTVEMRHEVLKSIVGILGLSNVSFLKDNIKVEGKYGTYVINIRTGLVFKEGKGNLALDTIYSVDKPILLDFVDEDPMTADIISKAVVLANDTAIKDPAILREIIDTAN